MVSLPHAGDSLMQLAMYGGMCRAWAVVLFSPDTGIEEGEGVSDEAGNLPLLTAFGSCEEQ